MTKLRVTNAQVSRIGSNRWREVLAAAHRVPRQLVLLADRFLGNARDVEAIGLGRLGAVVFLGIWVALGILSLGGTILGAALNSALIEFTVVDVIAIIFG